MGYDPAVSAARPANKWRFFPPKPRTDESVHRGVDDFSAFGIRIIFFEKIILISRSYL